jgi:CubicO group peptidase (beta-lactamase class C family)
MSPYHRLPLLLLLSLAACAGGDDRDAAAAVADATIQPAEPTVGLDSAHLARAVDRASALPRLYSFLVYRHGEIFSELYFHGRGPETRANIKSASKSIISTLVGIAIQEGTLAGVDQPILPFFSRYVDADADSSVSRITLGNLLSMQSGLESTSSRNYGRWVNSSNWIRHAITRPMVDEPGGRMLYSTGTSHLLSAILTQATGQSTHAYARARLAEPLGIDLRPWPTDPQGIFFGGNEMRMTSRDLLRIGELYLADGKVDGEQILSSEWIHESWNPRTTSRFNRHRYGYGWWIKEVDGHPVYFAWGYGGQFLFVVPDLDLIVVTTSMADEAPRDGGHLRELHAILDEEIIPAAEDGEES